MKIICPERLDSREHQNWPVVEVTTGHVQGKYGVEIRIESASKDNSPSWVRRSHGSNKLVTDLIDKEYDDNEQETSEMQFEDYALKSRADQRLKQNHEDLPLLAHLQELYLSVKDYGLLSQELDRISITQCQKTDFSSSSWSISSRRRWSD